MRFIQDVRMLFTAGLLLKTDPLLQATCIFNSSAELKNVIGNIIVNRSNVLPSEVQGNVDNLLSLTIQDEHHQDVTENSTVKLGDVLTFHISMKENMVYDSIRLLDIVASSGVPGDSRNTSLNIIQNSCTLTPDVLQEQSELYSGSNEITVNISAFRFLDSSIVTFTIRAVMCNSNYSSECKLPPDCHGESLSATNASNGVGRRRRRDVHQSDVVTWTAGFHIDDATPVPNNINAGVTPQEETNVKEQYADVNFETCLQNSDVQILVALLSAGIVVIFLFSVALTVCSLRKSNRKQVVDPDLQSPGSSLQTLYVPRATASDLTTNAPYMST